jgi:hypothetical protein
VRVRRPATPQPRVQAADRPDPEGARLLT